MVEKIIVLKKTNGKECMINVEHLASVEEKGNGIIQIRTGSICIDIEMAFKDFMNLVANVEKRIVSRLQAEGKVKVQTAPRREISTPQPSN